MMLRFTLAASLLTACAADTNDVEVRLAPEVVSSLDGTLSIETLVLADREPADGQKVSLTFAYTDRNGKSHDLPPVSGSTDSRGMFSTSVNGLTWDGSGTVTAAVGTKGLSGTATFGVLDRTPPVLTIVPPAASSLHAGSDVTVSVHITDEIGVSSVDFEWNTQFGRSRSTIVASGSTDAMVDFDFRVPDQVGSMVTLYALGEDLSGNQAAAPSITVTVVQ